MKPVGAIERRPVGERFEVWDVHVHLLGRVYKQSNEDLEKGGLYVGGGMKPLFPNYSPEELIEQMDKGGVDKAVTFAPIWVGGNLVDPNYEQQNLVVAEAQEKYPDRIIGFAHVNPNFGKQAVAELRKCFKDYGLQGMKMHPDWDQYPATSILVRPLLDLCAEHGVPIVSHTGGNLSGPMKFLSLAELYPTVKMVMLHAAGKQIGDACRCVQAAPNLFLGTSGQFPFALNGAIKAVGPERVCYGSDHPYGPFEVRMGVIDYVPDLSEDAKALIFGQNLKGILTGD
jgi:predicted TIM-barrel fold metal-dependent hydrolase